MFWLSPLGVDFKHAIRDARHRRTDRSLRRSTVGSWSRVVRLTGFELRERLRGARSRDTLPSARKGAGDVQGGHGGSGGRRSGLVVGHVHGKRSQRVHLRSVRIGARDQRRRRAGRPCTPTAAAADVRARDAHCAGPAYRVAAIGRVRSAGWAQTSPPVLALDSKDSTVGRERPSGVSARSRLSDSRLRLGGFGRRIDGVTMTETPSIEPEAAAAAAPAPSPIPTPASETKAAPFWKRLLGKA